MNPPQAAAKSSKKSYSLDTIDLTFYQETEGKKVDMGLLIRKQKNDIFETTIIHLSKKQIEL